MANYRNPSLLRLAAKAPYCFSCQAENVGQVVAAHSNHHADGKGMGIKASDAMVCFICNDCHSSIDQGDASRELKRAAWVEAYMATMRWLVESGHFIVSPVPTPPPVITDKPSRPIPKSKQPIPARVDPWGPKGVRKLPTGKKFESRKSARHASAKGGFRDEPNEINGFSPTKKATRTHG